jgi:outer membrane protein TolC
LKTLEMRVSAKEATPAPADAPLTLSDLVHRAQQRSPEVLRTELRGLLDEAELDQQITAGLPRVGVEADYGRSAVLRRDEPEGLLRVSPGLQWDVVRMLQMARMKRLRGRSVEAAALQQHLAREQVELEVVRRYAEVEAARAAAALAEARAGAAARAARLSQLQGPSDSAGPDAEANAAVLGRQLRQAQGRAQVAFARLASLCALQPGEDAARYEEPAGVADPLPLREYLEVVLASSEGLKIADIRTALSAERARLAGAERWSMARLSSNAGDILQLLSSSPFALLSWTYNLIDQGDFNRSLIKARADTVLSRLDRQDEAERLLDTGGRVWVALLDAAVERRKAEIALRQARLAERIAAAQAADAVAPPTVQQGAELTTAAAETDLRLRGLEHLVVATQYRLLGADRPAEKQVQ